MTRVEVLQRRDAARACAPHAGDQDAWLVLAAQLADELLALRDRGPRCPCGEWATVTGCEGPEPDLRAASGIGPVEVTGARCDAHAGELRDARPITGPWRAGR